MSSLLPHEFTMLRGALGGLDQELKDLAHEKSEAQGPAFDWHDNAALDAVERQLDLVRLRKATIDELLKTSVEVDYASVDNPAISLGSLVLAADKFGDMPFVVVGQRLVGIDDYKKAWAEDFGGDPDDFVVVTPASPLGQAALGAKPGESVTYQAENGRELTVDVLRISQDWVASRFGNEPSIESGPAASTLALPAAGPDSI